MTNESNGGLSRRKFIAGTVAGLAVGAAVGVAGGYLGAPNKTTTETATQLNTATQTTTQTMTSTAQPWLPAKWDQTADVVVVGFGGAGAVSAIQAHNSGANVLILEKMTQDLAGGNTSVSGGIIFTPSPAADAVTYLNAMSEGYMIPQDMVQTWAQQMGQNANWLTSIGGKPVLVDNSTTTPPGYAVSVGAVPEFPELPGADCAHEYADGAAPGVGADHYAFLAGVVQQLGIPVLYQTPATNLIQNPQTNEILGVQATSNGNTINVKASKAVILTLGGFENNPQMLRDYLNAPNMGPKGTIANTGDGIVMAKKVGAALWHLDSMSGNNTGLHPDPNQPWMSLSMKAMGYIFIGQDGNRFVNENVSTRHGKIPLNYNVNSTPTATTQWVPFPMPYPAHVIFDETTRLKGPITSPPATPGQYTGASMGWNVIHGLYTWSSDNSAEIAKGWIQQGATLQELAPLVNRDPAQLANVVAQYNTFCQQGVDPQFGRAKANLIPIVTPPYYAISLAFVVTNTQGGAKRNTKSQVVDDNDNPIPRLYSAGEFGSLYSWAYNGGGNLGEAIAFGTIAGQNAASEKPWS